MPPLRPARPAPAQRNQVSESILELKTGYTRNKGPKRIWYTRENKPKARLDTPQAYPAGARAASQSPLSVIEQKNEPPMRGSLILPEFVPKTKGFRFGVMLLEIKTGRKRNKGSKRIKHTRESLLSRSNSFLAQKHSPNQKPWAIMAAATFLKPAMLAPFI